MHPKLFELHTYLDRGYECVDIWSEAGRIDVVLQRGSSRIVLTLNRRDAAEILLEDNRRARVRRFLVKGPIRR